MSASRISSFLCSATVPGLYNEIESINTVVQQGVSIELQKSSFAFLAPPDSPPDGSSDKKIIEDVPSSDFAVSNISLCVRGTVFDCHIFLRTSC